MSLSASWSTCRQGETGKRCLCGMWSSHYSSQLVFHLVPALLSREQHSTQFRLCEVFMSMGMEIGATQKGWAPKQVVEQFFCRRGAESETWISGIWLCLNLSCLYQLTNHPVKFTCSLSPFPLFSCRWSTSGEALILPVKESAERWIGT